MKDVRENKINATEEVIENIRTIMLNEAEGFIRAAKKYYETYRTEDTTSYGVSNNGEMFNAMYAKACACYNNMRALGIISEKEEYMLIIEAFDKAAGTSLLETAMSK